MTCSTPELHWLSSGVQGVSSLLPASQLNWEKRSALWKPTRDGRDLASDPPLRKPVSPALETWSSLFSWGSSPFTATSPPQGDPDYKKAADL